MLLQFDHAWEVSKCSNAQTLVLDVFGDTAGSQTFSMEDSGYWLSLDDFPKCFCCSQDTLCIRNISVGCLHLYFWKRWFCFLPVIGESLNTASTTMYTLDEVWNSQEVSSESLYPVGERTENWFASRWEAEGEWVIDAIVKWRSKALLWTFSGSLPLELACRFYHPLTFKTVITGQMLAFLNPLSGHLWREHSLCQDLANACIPRRCWRLVLLKIFLCSGLLR